MSLMSILSFTGVFLLLERNEIDICIVLYILYSKGKIETKCSGILCPLLMVADSLS